MKVERKQFPQISDEAIYFDNAATTLKPQCVIDALSHYYEKLNANPRRGLYPLAVAATEQYERDRKTVAQFIGAEADEIVFTRGATESLNMLAIGLPSEFDAVVAQSEHHSNLLPWQQHHKTTIWPLKNDMLDFDELQRVLDKKTRVVAFSPYSNVLGKIITDDELVRIINFLHKRDITVVIDATQWIAHERIDVRKFDMDFLAFSAHKIYGPMGVGVLYGKREILSSLKPSYYGGEMVNDVSLDKITLADVPERFEAGTMNPAGAYALAEAIRFLENYDEPRFVAKELLAKVPHLQIYSHDGPILSFNIEGVHPHDTAQFLADNGIAVRAGYHCAQPLLDSLGIGPCVRASLGIYNTQAEIEHFIEVLNKVRKAMGYV